MDPRQIIDFQFVQISLVWLGVTVSKLFYEKMSLESPYTFLKTKFLHKRNVLKLNAYDISIF